MTIERASHSALSPSFAVQSAGALAVLAGGLVLAGWTLDIAALKSLLPNWVSVKPNTALAFILTGIAVLLSTLNPQFSTASSRLARLCGWLAGLIGLLTLCEYAFGWNPGFDQWLFREPTGAVGTSHPGRMAPDTALCFMLLAAGLENACGSRKTRRTSVALAILGSLLITVALAAMLSYFTSALRTHGWWGLTMMAVPTAAVFAVLGVALVLIAWRESISATDRLVKPIAVSGSHAWFAFLLVFLLLAAGILATGAFSYRTYERHFRAGIEQHLSAIAELKVEQIVQWRRERLADAAFLWRTPDVARRALEVLAQPASVETQRIFMASLESLFADGSYKQALLLDERLNVGLVYPERTSGVLCEAARGAAQEALSSQQVVIADLHRETEDGPVHLSLMVPLVVRRESTGNNVPAAGKGSSPADRSAGVLVLQISAHQRLYPLIQHWPTPSRTAETLLVRRDGNEALFLSELKFQTNTALKLRASLDRTNQPAVKAVLGQEGIIEGIDYRGVPVVAALRAIPDSPWSMVARMDLAEVYAPLRERLWLTVLLMGALLLGAGASVGLVWRQQRVQFYRERVETAEALRASEVRYRRLFEAAKDGILILDAKTGMVVDVNPFLVKLLGFPREAFFGKEVWELGFFKDIVANRDNFAELQEKEYIRYDDKPLETSDGRRVEVEFVSNVYLVNHHKVIQCNIRDISERKALEEQLRQSQKMAAVGQLAGGVAHEFNNALAVTQGNAELLLMDEGQHTAKSREDLTRIVEASERAANLARQLLAFSRKQVMQAQPLVLNEVIANLTKVFDPAISENIDLQCHYAAALPYVQADAGMMEQVILNLVVNARDAMPKGGQLCVTTEQISLDEAQARVNSEARAGDFVCLSVSDTGTGIAPEVLPRIFEPFFTTKGIGKGTGLGLATVYGIVQQHQGWLEVSSQVGEGSTFKVFLPAIPTPVRLAAAAEVRGGNETILLVEDEPALRLTTRRILERKGYRIREATNGQEALEVWQSHAGEISLLLTDIIMPGEMTGRDVAERLWGQRPGLKVIFTSGYTADVLGTNRDFIQRTRSYFLQKPCPSRALLETVRRCLDEKESVATQAGVDQPNPQSAIRNE
jgi:PAS domain S-box-containing protein